MSKLRVRLVLAATLLTAVILARYFLAAGDRSRPSSAPAPGQEAPPLSAAATPAAPARGVPAPAPPPVPASPQNAPVAPTAALAAAPPAATAAPTPAPTPAEPVSDAALADARMVASVTDAQGAVRRLTPDALGFFPRVYIQPRQIVPVSVSFAGGRRDEQAAVRVEDGGKLDGGVPAKAFSLDDQGNIRFTFQANADPGVYHLVVHKGSDERVLDFWVGPRMPVSNR